MASQTLECIIKINVGILATRAGLQTTFGSEECAVTYGTVYRDAYAATVAIKGHVYFAGRPAQTPLDALRELYHFISALTTLQLRRSSVFSNPELLIDAPTSAGQISMPTATKSKVLRAMFWQANETGLDDHNQEVRMLLDLPTKEIWRMSHDRYVEICLESHAPFKGLVRVGPVVHHSQKRYSESRRSPSLGMIKEPEDPPPAALPTRRYKHRRICDIQDLERWECMLDLDEFEPVRGLNLDRCSPCQRRRPVEPSLRTFVLF